MTCILTASFRVLCLTLLLGFQSSVFAWHHDGIPLDAYKTEPLANALYESPELEEHVELIFDASENDVGSPDSEYLELFGTCKNCAPLILDYVNFVACIRVFETSQSRSDMTSEQIHSFERNCRSGLAPLTFDSFKSVWASPDSNPFKAATMYFLAYLRLHQNRLNISKLIEY